MCEPACGSAVCLQTRAELSPPHRQFAVASSTPSPLSTPSLLSLSSLPPPRKARPDHLLIEASWAAAGGAAMGSVSAAAGWTAEDDVLLKNAVEVIYAALPDPTTYSPSIPSQLPRNAPAWAEFRRCSTNFPPRPAARAVRPGIVRRPSSSPSRPIRGSSRFYYC